MPDTWKRPEFWLLLLATAIALVLSVGLVAPDSVAGKVILVVNGLLSTAGIKASSVSVNAAYLAPSPAQPAVQVDAATAVVVAKEKTP